MGMKITSTGLAAKIGSNLSETNIISNIKRWWGIDVIPIFDL